MSIRPPFADKLLGGEKRVEFRRAAPREPIALVLVYATLPVGGLVGALEVRYIDRASPRTLWNRYRDVAGIRRVDFFDYFYGVSAGDALVVARAWRFPRTVALGALGLSAKPPQSFRYVDGSVLTDLPRGRDWGTAELQSLAARQAVVD